MEITINLKDILTDEFGDCETLGAAIKRQVIEELKSDMSQTIKNKIYEEIHKEIGLVVAKFVENELPQMLPEILNCEFPIYDNWGDKKGVSTLRGQIIKHLTNQMVYVQKQYDSDKNFFTKSVDSMLKENLEKFKKDFDKAVFNNLTSEAMKYAFDKLKQKLM